MMNKLNQDRVIILGFVVLICSVLNFSDLDAQQNNPVRSYRGDEFVTMNDRIPFNTALQILNQFSTKFENKVIIDPKRRQSPIGVVIDNMYWKKAFEYILNSNGLRYNVFDRYYEIEDLAEDQSEVKKSVSAINTTTREVLIEAIFFEADRRTLAQIGIDWSTFNNGKIQINADATTNLPTSALSVFYKSGVDVWDINILMQTFESLSIGELIAKPQIRVMEGVEGKVKVGQNFFLTTRDFAGNTQFREYEAGTILSVVPQIIEIDDTTFIHLDIRAERSQVIPDPTGVSKAITESKTQVLLQDGEQTVIAGLYSNQENITRAGIPFLKDLPWWFFGLRYVFGYNAKEIMKKELVVLIKADILSQVAKRKVDTSRQSKQLNSLQKKMFK